MSEYDELSEYDTYEDAMRIAEEAISEVNFKEQLRNGVFYTQLWFAAALASPSEGSVDQAAISRLCGEAIASAEAFEAAKALAEMIEANGKRVPEELKNLMQAISKGEIIAPVKRRGPRPEKYVLRDFLIYRIAMRLEERTDLKPTENAANSPERKRRYPSRSAIIQKALKKFKPDSTVGVPDQRVIERIVVRELASGRFRAIEMQQIYSMFDFD